MNSVIQFKTISPTTENSTNRSPLRRGFLLIMLAFACFCPFAYGGGGLKPPPDGDYPNANTAEGEDALFSLTTGVLDTAIGFNALYFNTAGDVNTADGAYALFSNTTGHDNTAIGFDALFSNIGGSVGGGGELGSFNTAVGSAALYSNTTGHDNTAMGYQALFSNIGGGDRFGDALGVFNTAVGSQALRSNNGQGNTAVGFGALFNNTNTVFGDGFGQRAGQENTAIGFQALHSETTSRQNTAIGSHAMYTYDGSFILPGYDGHNTAIGSYALYNIGSQSIWNIALGADAGLNLGSYSVYNIDIGNPGNGGESNTIRIGTPPQPDFAWVDGQSRTFIAGIRGVTTDNDDGIPVVIDSAGQLGTTSSSARFKTEIKPMDKASEAILELKPMTFHYKSHKSNTTGRPQFGLIAEDVAKVNPDLVVRDPNGQIYTVRYDAVNAMLLNEFLKEHNKVEAQHRKIQEQEATIAELRKEMETRFREQDLKIQKVNDQLEASKPAAQTVVSNQ